MSQNIEDARVKYTIFDRKSIQKSKLYKDNKHLERKDCFDIQKAHLKELGNFSSIDRGFASRTVASTPLLWKTLLAPNFVLDAYGDQEVHLMDEILKAVEESAWHNLPLNGEILIKKYVLEIQKRRSNNQKPAYVTKESQKTLIPIANADINQQIQVEQQLSINESKSTAQAKMHNVNNHKNDVVGDEKIVDDKLKITKAL